jgi:hypothetical protein
MAKSLKKSPIRLKNIPPALLQAVNGVENWGPAFRCENLRELPAAASLEQIEQAAQLDAQVTREMAEALENAASTLDRQSGRYSDHRHPPQTR